MKKAFIITIILLAAFKSFSQTSVEGLPFSLYAGLKADYFTLGGAFDGKSYLVTDDASMFVPKIEPGIALGIQAGLKFKNGSLDIGYQLSKNNYSHANDSSGAMLIHNLKLLGMTFYLNKSEKLRPYIVSDMSLPWMSIKNGAYGINSYDGQTGKSYFSGVVLGLGAGIEWNAAKNISIHIEALPEWLKLANVKGITKEYWDVKKFSCFKMNLSAGLYFNLFL